MASKKLTGAALAQSRVHASQGEGAKIYHLPVNPGFAEPNVVDKTRGVEYPGASENVYAEQGIARRVIASLQPPNLESWIRGQIARRGGAGNVARALLARTTPNATKAQYKAQLRKVEEWRQGKYKKAAGGNALRVGLLRLEGARHLVIGVRGLWQIDEKEFFRVFNSDPRETAHVQAALDALRLDGAGFISAVIDIANEYTQPYQAQLLNTHELRVEVNV
jgi:hypothetical protein